MAYYNQNPKTRVTKDASPVGLGAILEQEQPDGGFRPVYYASRKLSKGPVTRCNFSCSLQRNSTLGRCKMDKYMVPRQFDNIFLTYQTFVTNLHLLKVELHCKLQENCTV